MSALTLPTLGYIFLAKMKKIALPCLHPAANRPIFSLWGKLFLKGHKNRVFGVFPHVVTPGHVVSTAFTTYVTLEGLGFRGLAFVVF